MPGRFAGRIYFIYYKLLRLAGIKEIPLDRLKELLEMSDRAFYDFLRFLVDNGLAEVVGLRGNRVLRLLDPAPEVVNSFPWKKARREGVPLTA